MTNHARRPQQDRSKATVEAIVEAAAQLLIRDGPDTTTNHIAERAGVSVGSLYRYFPDKQAVFNAVTERYVAKLDDAFRLAQEDFAKLGPIRGALPAVRRMCAVELEPPRVGNVLNRMRMEGWHLPALTAFEARAETAAITFLRGQDDAAWVRGASAEIVGPILARAVYGTMRATLACTPDLVLENRFAEVLAALLSGYLQRYQARPSRAWATRSKAE